MGFLGLGTDAVTDRTDGKGTSTQHMIWSQPTRASRSPWSVTIPWKACLDLPALNPGYMHETR